MGKHGFKCELVDAKAHSKLTFSRSMTTQRSYWARQIQQLKQDGGNKYLKLLASDVSSLAQLKLRAKQAGVILLFAIEGEHVFVKAYPVDGARMAILSELARGDKPLLSLQALKLEMDLKGELRSMAEQGLIQMNKVGEWSLTSLGRSQLTLV